MFPHCNIHKYTWTSSEGKMHNQIDHILTDRRWHSSRLDVQPFRQADCDTNNYVAAAKARERLAAQMIDMERFNLKKLNEGDVNSIRLQSETSLRNAQNCLIKGSRLNYSGCRPPCEVKEDNLSNVPQKATRHSMKKKREYLKDKINELESNSKNKNIRDLYRAINEFKKGYQPRINLVKDEGGNLLQILTKF
jgi:hypothetical protein